MMSRLSRQTARRQKTADIKDEWKENERKSRRAENVQVEKSRDGVTEGEGINKKCKGQMKEWETRRTCNRRVRERADIQHAACKVSCQTSMH